MTDRPRAALSRAFLVALGGAPYLFMLLRSRLSESSVHFAEGVFEAMCRSAPGRALSWSGAAMPVCSRCAGFYAGLAAGAVVARPRMTEATSRLALLAAAALAILDVAAQDAGLHSLWHSTRLATGAALGWGLTMAAVSRGR